MYYPNTENKRETNKARGEIMYEEKRGGEVLKKSVIGNVLSYNFALRYSGVAAGLVVLAIVIPSLCHRFGLPVRAILPMHWPVLLAGLLLGSGGGAAVGVLSPFINWLLTGYPLIPKLVPMMGELGTYGALVGVMSHYRLSPYLSILAAQVGGRLVFMGLISLTSGIEGQTWWGFIQAAFLPGTGAIILQIALLPSISRKLGQFLHLRKEA